MNVLDLFSGLGGWNRAFKDRGHKIVSVDIDPIFNPTISIDVGGLLVSDLSKYGSFDVIVASPPCNKFSLASACLYWKDGEPSSPETFKAIDLVHKTFDLIKELNPSFWFMENPRGMLRRVIGVPPVTLYYAQYGENRLKPTDIWGKHPEGFKEMQILDRTQFDYDPNGTRLEGDVEMRAKVPYELSLAVCKLCERCLP